MVFLTVSLDAYREAGFGVDCHLKFHELRDKLTGRAGWVKAPRSKIGWTEQLLYTLQGPFSTAERQKAANFRRRTPADVEVASDQLAPVWTLTLVEFMTGKAPTPDELMSRKGTA